MHVFIVKKMISLIALTLVLVNLGFSINKDKQMFVSYYDSTRLCTAAPLGTIFWLSADSTTQDLIGNNHGTAYNDLLYDTGQVGLSFSFDGIDDYIIVEDSGRLILGTNDFTIEGWIFPTAYNGAGGWNAIITRHNGDNGSWLLRIAKNGFTSDIAKLNMEIDFPVQRYFSNSEITLNEWHHIAITRSGSNCTFYLDGNFDGQFTNGDDIFSSTQLIISGQVNAGNERFTGKIDELSMYNRALTQEELQSIVSAGSTGKCKPRTGSISGVVYVDKNMDGAYQYEEMLLADQNVKLYALSNEIPIDSTTTNENGLYMFDSLWSGEYVVKFQLPIGWNATTSLEDTVNIVDGVSLSKLDFGIVYSLDCEIANGWNLVSVPLTTKENRKTFLFPTATSKAFAFLAGYNEADSLEKGVGYWLKFDSVQTVNFVGIIDTADTFTVRAGWNIIGSLNVTIQTTCIIGDGTNIVTPFFEYTNGYVQSITVSPCKGYWIKVSSDGKLIIRRDCYKEN